jgi:hypothetical protein
MGSCLSTTNKLDPDIVPERMARRIRTTHFSSTVSQVSENVKTVPKSQTGADTMFILNSFSQHLQFAQLEDFEKY